MNALKLETGRYHVQIIHDADAGGIQIITLLDGRPIATVGIQNDTPILHAFETGKAVGSLAVVDGQPVVFDADCKQVFPVPYTLAVDPSHLLN